MLTFCLLLGGLLHNTTYHMILSLWRVLPRMQNIHAPSSFIKSAFYRNYKDAGHGLSPNGVTIIVFCWSRPGYTSDVLLSIIVAHQLILTVCGQVTCNSEWQRVYHDLVRVNSNVGQFEHIYAPPFVTGKTHSSRQKSQQLYTKIGFVLTGKKTQKTDILNHPSFYYRSFTLHTLRCCLRDPWLRKLRILIGNTYASNAKLYQFHFCSTCVCCGWNISVQPKP